MADGDHRAPDKPRSPAESAERCRRVLHPRSVAVIGASPKEATLHGRVVPNLLGRSFPGPVYPVNPRYDTVAGLGCHDSVEAIGAPVDLALLLVGAERVPAALDDCIGAGVPAAALFSSGFGEAGPAGQRIEAEVAARTDRIVIAGPNCNGLLSQPAGAALGFAPTLEFAFDDAPRALISQSGAVGTSVATRAVTKGLGFRYVIATGNEVDLGVEDYLFFLAAEDDPVRSCLLFLETIRDVARFAEAAVACHDRGIRLIALKVGRSERARGVSATHTGALAGPFALYRALFDTLAIWSVDTIEELYLCAQFDWWDDRVDGGLAMLAFSGGQAALAADEAEDHDLALADLSAATVDSLRALTGSAVITNPFDCSGQVVNDPDRWHGALAAMAGSDGAYGLVALLSVIAGGADGNLLGGVLHEAQRGSNVALVWPSGNSPRSALPTVSASHVPVFERIEDAVTCLAIRHRSLSLPTPSTATLQAYLASLRGEAPGRTGAFDEPPALATGDLGAPLADAASALDQALAAAGVSAPAERLCADRAAVESAFAALGGPVVLKAAALLHKSDSGGVVLDLRTLPSALKAADRLAASHGYPLLVQQQVAGIREVLVGFSRDDLGIGIVAGAGGVLAEVLRDTVTLLAPVDEGHARRAIGRLAVSRLLAGYRHLGPVDPDRLVGVVVALARFAVDQPGVVSVDLNPIIVSDDGWTLWSVDRKVVPKGSA